MTESLTNSRLVRGPTQITKVEQLVQSMFYRFYLTAGTMLFELLSIAADKGNVKVRSVATKGTVEIAGPDIDTSMLGIVPVKSMGHDAWFPHWLEPALDAYISAIVAARIQPPFINTFVGGVLENFGDSYVQADIKAIDVLYRKITCDKHRMWAPEMNRWFPMEGQQPELVFTDVFIYPDGRVAAKVDNFWVTLNPKR